MRSFGSEIVSRHFFRDLKRYENISVQGCSRSSVSEARAKLPWQAVESLLEKSSVRANKANQWKGHTVRAVDGSIFTLPRSDSIENTFPVRTREHYPRTRVTCAVNVLTGQPSFADIDDIYSGERDQLERMVKKFLPRDVLLLDRGFIGFKLWRELTRQKLFFVNRMRVSEMRRDLSSQLLQTGKTEMIVEYKGMTLRLVRTRKSKRRSLVIATNLLDIKKYSRKSLLELYKQRWEVETQFKKLKQNLQLKKFHARTLNGVLQEVFCGLLMLSLITGLTWEAGKKLKDRKINFTSALDTVWQHLPLFINGYRSLRRNLREIESLLHEIAAKTVLVRPGRSYPRVSLQSENKWIKARRTNNHVEKGHWRWSDQYR